MRQRMCLSRRSNWCASPQMGTDEDMVLGKLMGILNNEELVAAMRSVERRPRLKIVAPE